MSDTSMDSRMDAFRFKEEWKKHQIDLTQVVAFVDKYEPYLEMLMRREERRETFQRAVIEKTMTALLWAAVVAIGYALWDGGILHLKSMLGK